MIQKLLNSEQKIGEKGIIKRSSEYNSHKKLGRREENPGVTKGGNFVVDRVTRKALKTVGKLFSWA